MVYKERTGNSLWTTKMWTIGLFGRCNNAYVFNRYYSKYDTKDILILRHISSQLIKIKTKLTNFSPAFLWNDCDGVFCSGLNGLSVLLT